MTTAEGRAILRQRLADSYAASYRRADHFGAERIWNKHSAPAWFMRVLFGIDTAKEAEMAKELQRQAMETRALEKDATPEVDYFLDDFSVLQDDSWDDESEDDMERAYSLRGMKSIRVARTMSSHDSPITLLEMQSEAAADEDGKDDFDLLSTVKFEVVRIEQTGWKPVGYTDTLRAMSHHEMERTHSGVGLSQNDVDAILGLIDTKSSNKPKAMQTPSPDTVRSSELMTPGMMGLSDDDLNGVLEDVDSIPDNVKYTVRSESPPV